MKHYLLRFYCVTALFISFLGYGQNISLYEQFNGRYDFTFIGNTLNTIENNSIDGEPNPPCTILTESSATLTLSPNDIIERAFLYWAGSGAGDFEVMLNDLPVTASRTFSVFSSNGMQCFSAFADITPYIQSTGNANYTFSGMDLTAVIPPYCPTGGNFGGWAIIIIYRNDSLPLNQLNVYDGMQSVPTAINITLNSLNVIDNIGAKIGFVAWEGDKNIANNESLRINGNLIGNALNPSNNAFNGTNSFTNSSELYNMDLDVYDIQNNIQPGNTSALIQLTSSQDFVMVNAIVTKLNSQLPDATVSIDNVARQCNSRIIDVDYTVYNLNSTDILPAGVKVSIFAGDVFLMTVLTPAAIPIGGSENGFVTLTIPDAVPLDFELRFIADSNNLGVGTIRETDETNNEAVMLVSLPVSPDFVAPQNLLACNEGLGKGTFDFSAYADSIKVNPDDLVSFFNTAQEAAANTGAISNTAAYAATPAPKEIFVRIQDSDGCVSFTSFMLTTRNCPPRIYNLVEPDLNNFYDTFLIDGLRDIFLNFRLSIYNRWGVLVWTGNNNTEDWKGEATKGVRINGSELPAGTYFYVLELNDPEYPNAFTGFVYLKR